MSNQSDADLILQVQEGSLEALGVLYDRHRQLVFRTVLAISGDPDVANDLLQDVFLRLYRFIDRVDTCRPLEPWLYRMSTNLTYTWVKRNTRWTRPLDEMAEWLGGGGKNSPHDAVERKDDVDQIHKALSSLSPSQRVVVVLYYLNDLSLHEISEILEIPVGTVKSRLHYGRQALKKKLDVRGLADRDKLPDFKYEGS
ncbi:MAG: RNA polymerase sigma factor [Chloroflexota bacterium]|nr:RNA polymerase sigma factor [Chloroflexota bacterium]